MPPTVSKSTKAKLKPKRHHGYSVVLFVMGTLFPPLAVAARFGIGKDFWLNLLLTICGYIPGHCHNFYIQNVRNNKNHARTPKWIQRYGLVDTSEIKRKEKKSEWARRYNDRLPASALEGQEYEEGEVAGPSREDSITNPDGARSAPAAADLWHEEDERYYNQNGNGDNRSVDSGSGGGRWHYPANFEDTMPSMDVGGGGKKKKKKDRWARTEDAYANPDDGSTRKKKKKKKNRSTVGDGDSFDRRSGGSMDVPEDPEGDPYADLRYPNGVPEAPAVTAAGQPRDELDHEF